MTFRRSKLSAPKIYTSSYIASEPCIAYVAAYQVYYNSASTDGIEGRTTGTIVACYGAQGANGPGSYSNIGNTLNSKIRASSNTLAAAINLEAGQAIYITKGSAVIMVFE